MQGILFSLPVALVPLLAGCLGGAGGPASAETVAGPSDDDLRSAHFDTEGPFSKALALGALKVLAVEDVRFDSFDGTEIAAALWRPDVPAGEKVPVILMISPYFATGLFDADPRTAQFFLESFVPHGYAFAKVAIRGTSFSDGCMESMGPNEQRDIDEMVTFFGTQAWSNGNVSIIGLSYVGTTPWAAATFGNPHLKAIVPMAGVTSWFELGFRNGSAEPRTPIHMPLYWANYGGGVQVVEMATAGDDAQGLVDNACPAPAVGLAASQYAIATGEMGPFADYWEDRDLRDRVVENYEGAVFIVHGLRDWNVNADMSFPLAGRLVDKGLEVKILVGQWQHAWPDQVSRAAHVRFDFAEVLLRWFDRHLKGIERESGPHAEVEDNLGLWRAEETWPPADARWTTFRVGTGTLSAAGGASGEALLVNPAGAIDAPDCAAQGVPGEPAAAAAWFGTGPMGDELRFAGLARLHVTVVPSDARGGEVQAELYHRGPGGELSRVAHAVMDLRFHAGGHEPRAITAGQPIVARMEFYPADVAIPAGHELLLRIVPDANIDPCTQAFRTASEDSIQGAYLPGQGPAPLVVRWGGDASLLHLPVVERDVGDGRYAGQPQN